MPQENNDVVFVYGALRSGTTVFRLMLNAHPTIANPGEMDFLFDHLTQDSTHPSGWRYDIQGLKDDRIFQAKKLDLADDLTGLDLLDHFLNQLRQRTPGKILSINVHRHVDRLVATLPTARIIHMLRDPRDVARSSIAMGWASTLYHGVGHWIGTEQAWENAVANANPDLVLQINYESLFLNIEDTLARVCAFMGLPYDQTMLQYHENSTYAPPDPKLIEQWRRKCSEKELIEMESRAAFMMEKRGYALAYPRQDLSLPHRLQLATANKIGVWTFGMRRFGVATYWAEKLTRWTGLNAPHRFIKQRMDRILVQTLK